MIQSGRVSAHDMKKLPLLLDSECLYETRQNHVFFPSRIGDKRTLILVYAHEAFLSLRLFFFPALVRRNVLQNCRNLEEKN